jgi:hypothetical protein
VANSNSSSVIRSVKLSRLFSMPNGGGSQMPEDVPLKVEAWPIEKVIA